MRADKTRFDFTLYWTNFLSLREEQFERLGNLHSVSELFRSAVSTTGRLPPMGSLNVLESATRFLFQPATRCKDAPPPFTVTFAALHGTFETRCRGPPSASLITHSLFRHTFKSKRTKLLSTSLTDDQVSSMSHPHRDVYRFFFFLR